jgi:hypothetical protein
MSLFKLRGVLHRHLFHSKNICPLGRGGGIYFLNETSMSHLECGHTELISFVFAQPEIVGVLGGFQTAPRTNKRCVVRFLTCSFSCFCVENLRYNIFQKCYVIHVTKKKIPP